MWTILALYIVRGPGSAKQVHILALHNHPFMLLVHLLVCAWVRNCVPALDGWNQVQTSFPGKEVCQQIMCLSGAGMPAVRWCRRHPFMRSDWELSDDHACVCVTHSLTNCNHHPEHPAHVACTHSKKAQVSPGTP